MIRYDLICEAEHGFDTWFRSSADFDLQAERGLLSCPICGSAKVRKALMAPAVASGGRPREETALMGEREKRLREMVREVRDGVMRNARNVGHDFARVAREMHDGEVERESIWGKASFEEAKSLAEDGVVFHPLPTLAEEGN